MIGAVRLLSFQERRPTAAIQSRITNLGPATAKWPAIMRKGEGSIEDQFRRQSQLAPNGRIHAWPRAKPFGNQRAPARTLKRSGRYLAAWLGEGAGAVTVVTAAGATIGVSSAVFPQVAVFQASGPTSIRVTPRMRAYLGMAKGVWLRRTTKFIVVTPRPFSRNPAMTRRCRQVLVNYVVNNTPSEYVAGGGRAAA